MTGIDDPTAFMARALCPQTDPMIFYPEDTASGAIYQAKRVCAACEVTVECLQYALDNREQYGVWGGMSTNERRALLRRSGMAVEADVAADEDDYVASVATPSVDEDPDPYGDDDGFDEEPPVPVLMGIDDDPEDLDLLDLLALAEPAA